MNISETKNVNFTIGILQFQCISTESTLGREFISWKSDVIPILLNYNIKTLCLKNIETDIIRLQGDLFLKCAFRKKAN